MGEPIVADARSAFQHFLARAVGFEPTNVGIKTRCLRPLGDAPVERWKPGFRSGSGGGTRTHGLQVMSLVICQLIYPATVFPSPQAILARHGRAARMVFFKKAPRPKGFPPLLLTGKLASMETIFVSNAPAGLEPHTHGHFQRLGTVDLDTILDLVGQPEGYAMVLGQRVKVHGLRLETFKNHPRCCSDPNCSLTFSHFAVERSLGRKGAAPAENRRYHLNLYAVNSDGQEVLFTHDHTLARALGGPDDASNTTPMCAPHNAKKSVAEHLLVKEQRMKQGLDPHSGGPAVPRLPPCPLVFAKRLARIQARLEQSAARSGMTLEAYRAHCEEQGKDLSSRNTPQAEFAESLGLSKSAFRYFRHDFNQQEIAARRGPVEATPMTALRKPRMG